MKFAWITLCLFLAASLVGAEKGRLPPLPEQTYNSMSLDYKITGAILEEKTYSQNKTCSYQYRGKLDPSFGGLLRLSGQAQWLANSAPGNLSVVITAGNTTRRLDYSPSGKMQKFDLAVPIGKAREASFRITMKRAGPGTNRTLSAAGELRDLAPSLTGGVLDQQRADDLLEQEMGDAKAIARNQIFSNCNDQPVSNGATPPQFALTQPTTIYMITNYHYAYGGGASAGNIYLHGEDGKYYGPWPATLVKKFYWVVSPQLTLPAGKYQVIDSDPGSWSQNGTGAGHVLIKGHAQEQ